ncbi:MAG: acyltransferase [Bacteroidia bacterium]|nr:acyltransferase [Bacteroidia bacterium]
MNLPENKFQINITNSRIPQLDGFRGFALCAALLWHYYACEITAYSPFLKLFKPATDMCIMAVDLFFVLSGFLIASILIESKGSPNFFKTFYVRRILRIFPIYYIVYGLFLIGILWGGEQKIPFIFQNSLPDQPIPLWSYAIFVQNFFMDMDVQRQIYNFGPHFLGITWSVTIEEQFYVLAPFFIWVTPKKHLIRMCCVFIAGCWGVKFALFGDNIIHTYVTMPARMDSLLMGVIIARLVQNPEFIQKIFSIRQPLYILLLVQLILSMALIQWVGSSPWYGFLFTFGGLMWSNCLLLILADRNGPVGRFFSMKFFMWLGSISYTIYLTHQAINGVLHQYILHQAPIIHYVNGWYNWKDIAVTLTSLLLSFVLAHFSFKYFEKPLIKKGHSFKY